MLKIDNFEVLGWEHAIRGMRNPLNSWDRSDSYFGFGRVLCKDCIHYDKEICGQDCLDIGPNDHDLMMRLRNAGTDHRKFMRMITVYLDITAPLYWWKEFDTYKVGTVANSCSTMHKIAEKEFTLDDFSHEHLMTYEDIENELKNGTDPEDLCCITNEEGWGSDYPDDILYFTMAMLNKARELYLKATEKLKRKDLTAAERKHVTSQQKHFWWQMIQLLPSSYNQKRTVMLNYEVLANIYKSRKDHKLDEWHTFCHWIEELPYSEIIIGHYTDEEE